MKKKYNHATSAAVGLSIACCIFVIFCILGTLVITYLIMNETIGETGIEISVHAIVLLAMVACGYACKVINLKPIHSVIAGIVVMTVMFAGGLLIDGAFKNMLSKIVIISTGTIVSYVICIKNNARKNRKKNHCR